MDIDAAVQFIVTKPNGETTRWTCASDEDLKRNLKSVGGYALQFTEDNGIKEDVFAFNRLGKVAIAGRKFKILMPWKAAPLPRPAGYSLNRMS